MKKLRVLGVAAGNGPMLFPLKRYVVGNIENRACFHTPQEKQWRVNFGNLPFVRKLEDFKPNGKIDVIIGHPDCGHSSMLRHSRVKTEGKPKENPSMNLFIESINHFKPAIFSLENLPKLLQKIKIEEWEEIFSDYDLIVHCYSVSHFGNSQVNRKRLLMIGIKKKLSRRLKKYFAEVYPVNELKTTGELLKRVYSQPDMSLPVDRNLTLYDYRNPANQSSPKVWLSHQEVHDMWEGEFKGKGRWAVHTATMGNLPGVYRNLNDKYPNTLLKSPRQFAPSGWPMTLNNFRSIQGFPDKFKLYRDEKEYYYWFSKGIVTISKGPVYEMGLWFKRCLKRAWKSLD